MGGYACGVNLRMERGVVFNTVSVVFNGVSMCGGGGGR